jgi:glyoxylase-like metal-dependent hydrolase (beta-lactamase superfamily II)
MNQWHIGNVKITRVIETQAPMPGTALFADVTPDQIRREAEWLEPWATTPSGEIIGSFHSLILESQGKKIIVDTCIGNDKDRSHNNPAWTNLKLPFLGDLKRAGYTPDQFDFVLQTHLHVDHVGWNTVLKDGRWMATFENATYLIGGTEWDFYSRFEALEQRTPIDDAVRPIVEQERARFVESNYRITDEVWLEPSVGHTPGHHHVHISSGGRHAIITGDLIHHPIQCAYPEWEVGFDNDRALAKKFRRAFCEQYADRDVLIFGSHFATPSCGKIVRHGNAFRYIPHK